MTTINVREIILSYLRGLETYQLYELIRMIHNVLEEKIAGEYDHASLQYCDMKDDFD